MNAKERKKPPSPQQVLLSRPFASATAIVSVPRTAPWCDAKSARSAWNRSTPRTPFPWRMRRRISGTCPDREGVFPAVAVVQIVCLWGRRTSWWWGRRFPSGIKRKSKGKRWICPALYRSRPGRKWKAECPVFGRYRRRRYCKNDIF